MILPYSLLSCSWLRLTSRVFSQCSEIAKIISLLERTFKGLDLNPLSLHVLNPGVYFLCSDFILAETSSFVMMFFLHLLHFSLPDTARGAHKYVCMHKIPDC